MGCIPDLWNKNIIVPIPKCYNKDLRDPTNSRGLTIASAVYKLYCSILNIRLEKFDEFCQIIVDEQNGFRKKRSCIDHLVSLSNTVESRKQMKRSTFVAYIDFKRAYDGIRRDKSWYKLEKNVLG